MFEYKIGSRVRKVGEMFGDSQPTEFQTGTIVGTYHYLHSCEVLYDGKEKKEVEFLPCLIPESLENWEQYKGANYTGLEYKFIR